MNAIKTTHIDGDVSVGRNVSIGGRTTQQGNMHVKGSVKIDGWIDAKHIKAANKGLFLTAEDLMESYPEPRNGWWAIVGNTIPGIIHIAKEGTWYSTKQLGGSIEIDIDYYNNLFERLSDDVYELDTQLDIIDNKLEKIKKPLTIKRIISDDNIRVSNATCLDTSGEVVYLTVRKIFAYYCNNQYYVSWSDVYDYMLTDLSGPIPNRAFIMDGKHYIYANGELMLLANEIVKFHEIVDNAVFTDVTVGSSAEFDGKVYFIKNASVGDDNKNCPRKPIFANYYNGEYFASSSILPEYIKEDDDGTYSIREDKIYEYNGSLYVFNGGELLAVGDTNRIIEFHEVVDSGEISDKLPYANGTVVYIRDKMTFVNFSEDTYYRKWSGRNIYMDSTTELPHDNKIFRCENKLYVFNGTDMISLSGVDQDDLSNELLTLSKEMNARLDNYYSLSRSYTDNRVNAINTPTALSELKDDASHRLVTDTEKASWNAKSNFSGDYNDLKNKPNIPSLDDYATNKEMNARLDNYYSLSRSYTDNRVNAINTPTALSELKDDASHRLVTDTEKASWNAKSNFSGDYNDLKNKPNIPDVSGFVTVVHAITETVETKANKTSVITSEDINNITLDWDKEYHFTMTKDTSVVVYDKPNDDYAHSIEIEMTTGEEIYSFSTNLEIQWVKDLKIEPNKRYMIIIDDSMTAMWVAVERSEQ